MSGEVGNQLARRLRAIAAFVGGLQKVDICGSGCLLIKRDVFMRLKSPWFTVRVNAERDAVMAREDVSL